jgi:single-strand DNA-binding protein
MKQIKNHVQVIGRLGAEPEVKWLENGKKVARFSLAVVRICINKQGERRPKLQWHNVTAWGPMATAAEKLLHKGTQVTVSGALNVRSFINKSGFRRNVSEIVAGDLFVPQTQLAFPEVA